MPFRMDKVQFATTIPSFINIGTSSTTVTVSGSVGNGATQNFVANVTIPTTTTFFDVYAKNQNTNQKTKINSNKAIVPIYQAVSIELVSSILTFAPSLVTLTISIFNGSGGSITLTSQTYTVEVVEYAIPF